MVEILCGSGRPVDLVVGHAGTGKTFTLDAVRDAFTTSGHRVLGACLAARAARELQAGSGIPATTAHALRHAVATGRFTLAAGDVLVVDEAGMLGTRMLADLATLTGNADAKLILVGDPRQLPAVEAGGLFTALTTRLAAVELVDNRRQCDPDERLVAAALRAGSVGFAIRRLDRAGRVTVAANADLLREQMIADWQAHRGGGADVVMGALHRADVADLNARAHAALEAAGSLGPLAAVVDEQRFCVGERLLALRNRYDLGLVNGEITELVGTDSNGLRLRAGDREITVPIEQAAGLLAPAYARTVHKSQGLTCDVALLLGDDTLYAELGYTGLTRGRAENHLYAVASPLVGEDGTHDLAQVIAALETSRAKRAALDEALVIA